MEERKKRKIRKSPKWWLAGKGTFHIAHMQTLFTRSQNEKSELLFDFHFDFPFSTVLNRSTGVVKIRI